MATVIGAETVLGATVIGGVEQGHYVMRHGNNVIAAVPLRPLARKMQVGIEVQQALKRLEGDQVAIGGAFWNKIKKKTKKGISKVVDGARKVAKNKVTKELYAAAKSAAPSPYKEYIAGAETAVRFGAAMAKNTPKGKAAKKALPVVQKLAAGKISLKEAQKKGKALGLKANTIRDTAAAMKLRMSADPKAKAVIAVVNDIAKVTDNPIKTVTSPSTGKRYEVLVRKAV
jgi:hypothetical protein